MAMPPNSSSTPTSFGTPVHTQSLTTGYLGTKHLTQDQSFGVMSEEMAPFFLGPMPPQDFLSTFLPSSQLSSFQLGMFKPPAQPSNEIMKYHTFVSASLGCLSGLKSIHRSILFNLTSRHCTSAIHHTLQIRPLPTTILPSCLTAQFMTKHAKVSSTPILPSVTYISNSKAKWRTTPS